MDGGQSSPAGLGHAGLGSVRCGQIGHGNRRATIYLTAEAGRFPVGISQVRLADDDLAVFQTAEAEVVRGLDAGRAGACFAGVLFVSP